MDFSTIMDNSLAHLYGTNNVPTSIELQRLKELLAPDEAALSQLDEEIKQAEECLARLVKEKKAIQDRIQPLKALESLIRQMPDEIMQEIFLHSGPSSYSSTSGICDAPLLLLRVCRSWRDLALNTPRLWASPDIALPKDLGKLDQVSMTNKMDVYLNEIRRWIARSRDSPLSIRIRQDHFSEDQDPFFVSVVKEFLAHSPRLISIDFRVRRSLLETIAPILDPDSLTGLSVVKIWDRSYYPPSQAFFTSNLFKVKNLKNLHFLSSYCPKFTDLSLNWSNLTSLSIGASLTTRRTSHPFHNGDEICFSAVESLSILRTTPHLVSCTIMLPSSDMPARTSQKIEALEDLALIRLRNLDTLLLAGPEEELAVIIQRLEAPRIRHFMFHPWIALASIRATPTFQSSPLVDFLTRHGEGIESISLDLIDILNEDFIACLDRIPAAKNLSLGPTFTTGYYYPTTAPLGNQSIPFTDVHLALLTPSPHCLCPRLERFECIMPKELSQGAIYSFLDARLNPKILSSGVSRIQELSLSSMPLDFPLSSFIEATSARYSDQYVKLHFWKEARYSPKCLPPLQVFYPKLWIDEEEL